MVNIVLKKLAVGVAVGLLLFGNAWAIHPDNHLHVTRMAASVYTDCLQQLGGDDALADGMQAIIKYSAREDISPILRRWFNWHFFDAYKDDKANAMGRHFTGARKSLHHIFDRHADRLADVITKGQQAKIYEISGRLLHYIQDVTVPAHVAPIFHYKYFIFDRADYFDEMPEWETSSYTATAETCNFDEVDINDLKQKFNQVLNQTAFDTRASIAQPIPIEDNHPLAGKTWEVFWVIRKIEDDDSYKNTIRGFAPYGELGNDGFERFCNGTASERKACFDFFSRSYNSAVSATVKILLSINAMLQNQRSG